VLHRGVVGKPAATDVKMCLERLGPLRGVVGRRAVPHLKPQRHLKVVLVRGQHHEHARGLRDPAGVDRPVDHHIDPGKVVGAIIVQLEFGIEVELPVIETDDEILGVEQAGTSHRYIFPSDTNPGV
jgi:hypothetical protein